MTDGSRNRTFTALGVAALSPFMPKAVDYLYDEFRTWRARRQERKNILRIVRDLGYKLIGDCIDGTNIGASNTDFIMMLQRARESRDHRAHHVLLAQLGSLAEKMIEAAMAKHSAPPEPGAAALPAAISAFKQCLEDIDTITETEPDAGPSASH